MLINEPGRLLSVHLMHIVSWSGAIVGAFDPSDITFNPMWRQGMYVIPFITRLGVVDSWSGWSMLGETASGSSAVLWSYEAVGTSHIILAGLLFAASIWHWTYWDLDLFRSRRGDSLTLDLPKIFGIHRWSASLMSCSLSYMSSVIPYWRV